ncbi:Gamma-parvin [Thelohanellus kitauei]|uniref:Gamma-parvin n=1 Tax=Thelohanellus kitauei TaxID=669202 RepID=A0A0C2NLL4_THEKT|nr:Gamma-parvin [Thelohanellus kitauei]
MNYDNLDGVFEIPKKCLEEQPLKTYINNLLTWVQNIVYEEGLVVKTLEDVASLVVLSVLVSISYRKACDHGGVVFTSDETIQKLDELFVVIEQEVTFRESINKWNAKMIYNKYIPALLHLLTALYMEYCDDIPTISEKIEITIFQNKQQGMRYQSKETILDARSMGEKTKKDDVFEAIINNPDKLKQFEEGLLKFVNVQLSPMGRTVSNFNSDFDDGVNLILLCGALGNFYVAGHIYSLKPITRPEKESNIRCAFEILNDLEVSTTFIDVNEMVDGNKRATLKVLYSIFKRYK